MVSDNEKDNFQVQRLDMVHQQLQSRGITDQAVLDAMGSVPREEFIPTMYRFQAYADLTVPIGMGQTISQPFIIALMTQALQLDKNSEVLEIGTGSGFQTAVLASIAKKVYTVERLEHLSESSQAILGRLGFKNIEFYIGDGTLGWPEKRLFSRIIVTAAAPSIPGPLADQLDQDGIMIIPVGDVYAQQLLVCRKLDNRLIESRLADVRFVRLIGKHAFAETTQ
jgi:protein-L-isoaspartate(D-aspartate) O-methyltransferase